MQLVLRCGHSWTLLYHSSDLYPYTYCTLVVTTLNNFDSTYFSLLNYKYKEGEQRSNQGMKSAHVDVLKQL